MSQFQKPPPPPITDDETYNNSLDHIRTFELKEMTRDINFCTVCQERRIDMKVNVSNICHRCTSDKQSINMFSNENNMNHGKVRQQLQNLTIVEQQLISRISPCINVHMFRHGGLASNGHCVTFPQDISEPATIFPRLPEETNIIKVRRQGKNDTSKDFRVRRYTVQNALEWLQKYNPVYFDIIISANRLS